MKFPRGFVPLSALGAVIGGVVLLKDATSGEHYQGEERLPGRTVIVTGSNTGLGKATATDMAKRGARVIMACRDMEKCAAARDEIMEMANNKNVHCKKLDLASMKSVRQFAKDINQSEKRLDVLINNAGVMGIKKRTLTEDGFEWHLGVNYLGPFLLTNLLLDKLKENQPSRIVNVSSLSYIRGRLKFDNFNLQDNYDDQKAYSQSKLCVLLFNQELAKRLEDSGVTSYAVGPAMSQTEIGRNFPMSKSAMGSWMKPIWWLILHRPEDGCQTTIHCALSPEVSKQSGLYYVDCEEMDVEPHAKHEKNAQRLWAVSEKWTRLS